MHEFKKGDLVEITLKDTWANGMRFLINESLIANYTANPLVSEVIKKKLIYKSPFRSKISPEKFCHYQSSDLKLINPDSGSNISFTELMNNIKNTELIIN